MTAGAETKGRAGAETSGTLERAREGVPGTAGKVVGEIDTYSVPDADPAPLRPTSFGIETEGTAGVGTETAGVATVGRSEIEIGGTPGTDSEESPGSSSESGTVVAGSAGTAGVETDGIPDSKKEGIPGAEIDDSHDSGKVGRDRLGFAPLDCGPTGMYTLGDGAFNSDTVGFASERLGSDRFGADRIG